MRQGYTIVSSGWDPGVAAGGNRLTIRVPVAKNPDGSPVIGPSLEEFVIDNATTMIAPLTYPAAATDKSQASLTVRVRLRRFARDHPRHWLGVRQRAQDQAVARRDTVHTGQAVRVHLSLRGIRSSPAWASLPPVTSPHFCATRTATRPARPTHWLGTLNASTRSASRSPLASCAIFCIWASTRTSTGTASSTAS